VFEAWHDNGELPRRFERQTRRGCRSISPRNRLSFACETPAAYDPAAGLDPASGCLSSERLPVEHGRTAPLREMVAAKPNAAARTRVGANPKAFDTMSATKYLEMTSSA
jgi:hypothetical protein